MMRVLRRLGSAAEAASGWAPLMAAGCRMSSWSVRTGATRFQLQGASCPSGLVAAV